MLYLNAACNLINPGSLKRVMSEKVAKVTLCNDSKFTKRNFNEGLAGIGRTIRVFREDNVFDWQV